jgi:hypothetical protein
LLMSTNNPEQATNPTLSPEEFLEALESTRECFRLVGVC